MSPIQLLNKWLEEEKALGAQYAYHAVLSTQGINNHPHSRITAIREVTEQGILLFTQRKARKVKEIENNPKISLTFWFERHAREVIIEGQAEFLAEEQNAIYWANNPKSAQIRFCSYAPTSGLPINDKQLLENKRCEIASSYQHHPIPLSPDYCGILIKPERFVFYASQLDELSDVWEYQMREGIVIKTRLSP